MTVATLGPEGTFSHEIAERLFGADILLLPTIRSVFDRVEQGDVEGIVPIENSEAGGVGATLDGFINHTVSIIGEAYMAISHHLAAREPLSSLSVLYVHPQTHEQCSEFIDRLGIEVIHTSSNASSAQEAAGHAGAGAVTSSMAAAISNLPIIARNVQNSPYNVTRFVHIASRPRPIPDPEKCSILIDPPGDRVGLLHDLLAAFADRKINLSRIESRPSRRGMGSYIFYLDFEPRGDWQEALARIREMALVRELGCYRKREVA
ncbi:MAG: prephenate dehydratase domain-containing protein [Methanomicrobiaceae archaeon]|nr:prephenate dehydratase domain-containing protein [Methanomicrobiaceae archaeon]